MEDESERALRGAGGRGQISRRRVRAGGRGGGSCCSGRREGGRGEYDGTREGGEEGREGGREEEREGGREGGLTTSSPSAFRGRLPISMRSCGKREGGREGWKVKLIKDEGTR